MKLRQKLALVLASAMVVTAVPVVTFADTTNKVNTSKNIQAGEQVDTFITFTVSDFFDTAVEGKGGDSVAFITLTNGEFEADKAATDYPEKQRVKITTAGGYESEAATGYVSRTGKTELMIELDGKFKKDDQIKVPLKFLAKEGEIKVTIIGEDGLVTSTKHVLTENATKYATTVTTGDFTKISERGGAIAPITITESKIANLQKLEGGIKVELPSNSDLEFAKGQIVKIEGKKGYARVTNDKDGEKVAFEAEVKVVDNGQAAILSLTKETVKALQEQGVNSVGSLTFSGLKVVPQDRKDIKFSEVEVDIYSVDKDGDAKTSKTADFEKVSDVKVAEVTAYGVTLKTAKEVEVVAGKDAVEVSFNLTETIPGSLHANKLIDFNLDNGFFGIVNPDGITKNGEEISAQELAIDLIGQILVKDAKGNPVEGVEFYDAEIQKDGRVTGFTLDVSEIDKTKTNDLFFTVNVATPVQYTGDINLVVTAGGVDHEDLTTKLATVAAPYKVTTDAMTVKVGLNDQKGGKIVIEETAGNTLRKGELVILLDDTSAFDAKQDLKVVTTGDLKVTVDEVTKNAIILDVTRTSNKKEASTITISDIVFDVNRTIAEGKFDVALTGEAFTDVVTYEKGEGYRKDDTRIATKADLWTVGDFLVVNTPNTEDITNSGMKVGTASFTNGVAKFVSNGVEKEMNGTPYISKNNRMMVPFRYVGEAFGIDGNNIIFSNSTVTMLAGTRTIQLTNGSDVALLNGAPVKMEEAMIIKEDRTYIPIGEVAKLLGVKTSWDNDTKTATFSNEK